VSVFTYKNVPSYAVKILFANLFHFPWNTYVCFSCVCACVCMYTYESNSWFFSKEICS